MASTTSDDHTEIILFPAGTRENYLDITTDALPENVLFFEGKVEPLSDENRYYQVSSITTLHKIRNADKSEIDQLLAKYAYCETDTDCTTYYGACPFGCGQGVNVKFLDISQKIIENYRNNQSEQCEYGCVATTGVKCENTTCIATTEERPTEIDQQLEEIIELSF